MSLLNLPAELLLMIAHHITDDYGKLCLADLNSFLQVNRQLHVCLNTILWQEAAGSEDTTDCALTHLINTNSLTRLEFFLELGADVETELFSFAFGQSVVPTPLTVAATLDNVPMARLFLEKGAKVQYSPDEDEDEDEDNEGNHLFHAIHAARSAEMVQQLLDYGADKELADSCGDRPLHWYTRRGNFAAMRMILQRGADVDPACGGTREPTRSPLHEALMRRQRSVDAVKILLDFGADVKKSDNSLLETPLHSAVWTRDMRLVRLLLQHWPEGVREKHRYEETPLHIAVLEGMTDMVRLFLEYWPEGIRVNNRDGATLLHSLARSSPVRETMGTLRLLVESWPESRVAVNGDGQTPLQVFELYDARHPDISAETRREIVSLLGGVC
jgi:ankyrin repeat protein